MAPFLPIQEAQPNAWLLTWLLQTTSLTERLISLTGEATLTLLKQSITPVSWWGRYVLKLQEAEYLQREIVMSAKSESYWYARTLIPISTYQAKFSFFDRLKHESLGDLIYNEPKITRQLMYYPISSNTIEYHWLNPWINCKASILWIRLSTFLFEGQYPFYLAEIILPRLYSLVAMVEI